MMRVMVLTAAGLLAGLLMTPSALPAGLADRGVFSTLDAQAAIALPAWAPRQHATLTLDRKHGVLTVLLDGEPVKAYPVAPTCGESRLPCLGLREGDQAELRSVFGRGGPSPSAFVAAELADGDGDGIADSVDILLGAKKTVLLHSAYKETAPKLAFPGGDVPQDIGVCTDVIVRALRNAGIDLQKQIFEDAGRAPKAYPAIRQRNPNLDHRRVRNLAVYLKRHWRPIERLEDLLPGDVVLLDTFPSKPGPDHIGIVSDTLGPARLPLVINAWTNGFFTEEMDLLPSIPMTIAYRAPASHGMQAALAATAARKTAGLALPPSTRQLVLVVTEGWRDATGKLSLWEKDQERWRRRTPPKSVTVGGAGLGWGRGLHADAAAALGGPRKREGDARAPAGIFGLSSATGYAPRPPAGTKLPYQQATDQLRCVDDPASPDYNQLRTLSPGQRPSWASDEGMKRDDEQYRLTIFVEHNRQPVLPGAGSCILLHVWPAPGVPSPGCTMMSLADVRELLTSLDPRAHPVLVQLPRAIAEQAARAWNLPGEIP
jgi:uncharacterized protein YijF (DUF1287 family)/L,D-peptidoglycan transpeptidase YkuD (ErfK/YbiS/YcfS/YnhG family)